MHPKYWVDLSHTAQYLYHSYSLVLNTQLYYGCMFLCCVFIYFFNLFFPQCFYCQLSIQCYFILQNNVWMTEIWICRVFSVPDSSQTEPPLLPLLWQQSASKICNWPSETGGRVGPPAHHQIPRHRVWQGDGEGEGTRQVQSKRKIEEKNRRKYLVLKVLLKAFCRTVSLSELHNTTDGNTKVVTHIAVC